MVAGAWSRGRGGGGAGAAAAQGRCRGRRRTEVEAQAAAQGRCRGTGGGAQPRCGRREGASPGGGSLTACLVGDQEPGGTSVRLRWIWPRMAKSRALGAFFLTFGTSLCHQPVPKVHWYRFVPPTGTKDPPKIAREPLGFYHQPVPKGFSLVFFSCFIKTTITFERKVQMT